MIYEVVHTTQYDYDAPVEASFAEIRQLPDDVDGQVCVHREITSQPAPEHQSEHRDYFGNLTATVVIREPHTRLLVTSASSIDTSGRPTDFGAEGRLPWTSYTAAESAAADLHAFEFSLDSSLVTRSQQLADYAQPSFTGDMSLVDGVTELCDRMHADFEFDPAATEVDTKLGDVMELRKGVCQDFAHVMIGSLRSLGLAACYVSGYLETEPPPGRPRLTGVDRTHAWVGVYLGGDRWIGVDPTNNQVAGPRYVTAARGRDYADVPPLKGVIFTDAEESRAHRLRRRGRPVGSCAAVVSANGAVPVLGLWAAAVLRQLDLSALWIAGRLPSRLPRTGCVRARSSRGSSAPTDCRAGTATVRTSWSHAATGWFPKMTPSIAVRAAASPRSARTTPRSTRSRRSPTLKPPSADSSTSYGHSSCRSSIDRSTVSGAWPSSCCRHAVGT